MQITILKTEAISPGTLRYTLQLTKQDFTIFGFQLEAMEGLGQHHRCDEGDDILIADVCADREEEFMALVEALREMAC